MSQSWCAFEMFEKSRTSFCAVWSTAYLDSPFFRKSVWTSPKVFQLVSLEVKFFRYAVPHVLLVSGFRARLMESG